MKNYILPLLILLFGTLGTVEAQNTGYLVGTVTEVGTNEPLTGVNILIRGTSFGAASDFDGNYAIRNIRPGEYDIEVSYIGFERMLFTAIRIIAGETTRLDIKLKEQILSIGEDVVVVGERPIFDIEQSSTTSRVGRDQIQAASLRRVDDVVGQQAGVIRDPTGVYIRGGRAYETGFVIDGVSASDPLAGTGFGLDLGANAYSEVEVTTGGAGVEYGDATSGIVSVRTQDGGERLAGYFSHKRDNPGSMTRISHNFFTDTYEMTLGGPEPISTYLLPALGIKLPGAITFFSSGQIFLTNEFTRNPAEQVTSSIINNTFWTPRQDNRWSGMFKLTYRIKPGMRLEGAYQRSLTVNQNTRMLQVTGDDVQIRPGYQFFFSQNPDNANTYAHASNLSYVKWTHTLNRSTFYDFQVSRLFTRLRADANGKDWRPIVVDGELDPASIIVAPVALFDDSSRDFNYVLPGPGFANNGGLATLWHDHFAEEITVRGTLTSFQNNRTNRYNAGFEMKFMDYQWIDITRPWVGAPIITDGEPSISFRLGDSSDIWRVKPARGSLFLSDQVRYQGLIANIGFRFEYWFPGKYVDDAVNNRDALIPDQVREAYLNETYNFFGRRFKMRLLPRISVSFPVRENQVLYFNYGHMARTPHPTFMYAGLDPFYQDRSFLSNLGNPNLNQEVDISYEIGVRNQITSNDALNISAFWRDKYDFITSERIVITDPNTGREVERAYRVNGDFARVRGLEVSYIKRHKDWFNGQVSATYSRAEGLSSTTNDALQGIILGGQSIGNNVETPLAWDRPWDVKTNLTFTYDRPNDPMFGVRPLNKMKLFISANYRSGLRYTPYIYRGNERNPVTGVLDWRPIYEMNTDPSARFSEVGDAWYWIDLNFQRWFTIGDTKVTAFLEVKNVLNNLNAAIINPVTGKAFKTDYPTDPQLLLQLRNDRSYDLPSNIRDPRYVDPRSNTSPSYLNPANFLEQRHIMFGVAFNF